MGLNAYHDVTINLPADQLWAILADDFVNVSRWADGVMTSVADRTLSVPPDAPVGGRVCQVKGLGELNERFTSFDNDQRSFTFAVTSDGLPGFISNLLSRWEVTAVGPTRSTVRTTVTADLSGPGRLMAPVMSRKFIKTLAALHDSLKGYAETGTPTPAKVRQLAKAGV